MEETHTGDHMARQPWESDDQSWRGDEAGDEEELHGSEESLEIGKLYQLTVPTQSIGLKVKYRDERHFVLDPQDFKYLDGGRDLTFTEGEYLGLVDNCEWLPEKIKRMAIEQSEPTMFFVGKPAETPDQEFVFPIQAGNDPGALLREI